MNEDDLYEKMNIEDLFNEVWEELTVEKDTDKKSGKAVGDTLLLSRLAFVLAQKAKSYFNYLNLYKKGSGMYTAPSTELVLLDDDNSIVVAAFNRLKGEFVSSDDATFKAFLRACPEFARHGVLESIEVDVDNMVDTYAHLRAVMMKEDPNGCMILQPFVPATSSMVMAPNMYAVVGPDHDGVTAGHGRQLYFLMNPNETNCVEQFKAIGHDPNTYELEFVYERSPEFTTEKIVAGDINFTQVRGAQPHIPRAPPFRYECVIIEGEIAERISSIDGCIPDGTVTATEVWVSTGLEEVAWLEENITKGNVPDGFVISHPNGSLLSHVCAHARQHEVPYIVGEVNVGETWVEGSPSWVAKEIGMSIIAQPYDALYHDYRYDFHAGLCDSMVKWQRQHGWFAHFFHQWVGGMNLNSENAKLAGAFAGWAAKAALGLCLGEMRHSRSLNKDACVDLYPVMTAAIGSNRWETLYNQKYASTNRKHYYAAMESLNLNYSEIKMALKWCESNFKTGWAGGYGGKAWASCASGAAQLCDAICAFMEDPSREHLQEVIGRTNEAENFAHNNGSLYNKFLHGEAFNAGTMNNDGTSGLYKHDEKGLKNVFRTYELASLFLDGPVNNSISPPENDWSEIFSFALEKNATWYRQNMIATSDMVPSSIKEAVAVLPVKYIHLDNKFTLGKSDFVPCGASGCPLCETHFQHTTAIDEGNEISPMTSFLLNSNYPEAFFALGTQQSDVITYGVAQLIKAKQYEEVTPRMLVDAWNGLKSSDPAYSILSDSLKKHLKKMIATNPIYSKEVQTMMTATSEGDVE
mgnify:CR=1 FL=1